MTSTSTSASADATEKALREGAAVNVTADGFTITRPAAEGMAGLDRRRAAAEDLCARIAAYQAANATPNA